VSTSFADFVSEIQAEVNDTSAFLKTLIEKWINQAHHYICTMRDWYFLEVEKSDSMSIAPASMPFNISTIQVGGVITPARRILGVMDTTDGGERPLEFTTMAELRDNFPRYVTMAGVPRYWFWQNERINVFPGLDATRTFVFSFIKASKKYGTGSTEVLLIPDEWLSVLTYKVMEQVWKYRTDVRADYAKRDYEETLRDMVKAQSARTKIQYSSGKMQNGRIPTLSQDS